MRLVAVVPLVLMLAFAGGCGGSEGESANRSAEPAATEPVESREPTPTSAPAKDPANVAAAQRAVRDHLPRIPLWEGTTFNGVAVSDNEVCVNRVLTKEKAAAIGLGGRTSHVVVTVPDLTLAEPQDGPCGTPPPNTAAKAQRFFLVMDDLAIQLDESIGAAQNGDSLATGRIARLRQRIKQRNTDWLLSGADFSVGANLLQSAATTARDAARTGDLARLADQRREIAVARRKLAQELRR